MLTLIGVIGFCGYAVIALMSYDPLWFLGWTSVPHPERIVIRTDGGETVLTADSPGYDLMVGAVRKALSRFSNVAPLSAGLSEETLVDYQHRGAVLELYFEEPVNFHLPFNDGRPTALLVCIEGREAKRDYVFRGRVGEWWSGQMCISDAEPLLDAMATLGYIQR